MKKGCYLFSRFPAICQTLPNMKKNSRFLSSEDESSGRPDGPKREEAACHNRGTPHLWHASVAERL